MASFIVRIFREQSDYLAVVDGWGTVRSPTLRGIREEAKRLVREIVDGAFPPRTRIVQAEGIEAQSTFAWEVIVAALVTVGRSPLLVVDLASQTPLLRPLLSRPPLR